MGRLMDSVMAAFGLKPSDRVDITMEAPTPSETRQQQQEIKPLSPELEKLVKEIEDELPNKLIAGLPFGFASKPVPRKDENANESEDIKATIKELEEVPVAAVEEKKEEDPKDCFSCKFISVSLGYGIAGYCLYTVKTNTQKLTGIRLKAFRAGATMFAAMTAFVATCVAFDVNMASEDELKAQGERSPSEQLEFEVNYLKEKLGLKTKHQQDPENNARAEKS